MHAQLLSAFGEVMHDTLAGAFLVVVLPFVRVFRIRAASACVSRPVFHPSYASSNLIFRISCSSFVGLISPSSSNIKTGQIACYKTGQIKNSQHKAIRKLDWASRSRLYFEPSTAVLAGRGPKPC